MEIIEGRFKFLSKIDLKVQENERSALMGLDQKFRVWKLAGGALKQLIFLLSDQLIGSHLLRLKKLGSCLKGASYQLIFTGLVSIDG